MSRGKSDITGMIVCDIKNLMLSDVQYDCIYGNWALCYMGDEDVVPWLKNAKKSVNGAYKGVIILKETTRREDDDYNFEMNQNMRVRTNSQYLKYFA